MTLDQTKDTFLIWVKSCQTEEQLRLLEEIADEFIAKRFCNQLSDVIVAAAEISHAIYLQKEVIAVNKVTIII